jgi:hypothetical protein
MQIPRRLLVLATLSVAAAGCAQTGAAERSDDPTFGRTAVSLSQYPGAERQIRDYYESHGQEGDFSCGPVDMGTITRAAELANTPDQLKLAVHYEFSPEDESGRSAYCRMGFNTRIVTFSKSAGGLTLEKMSGELGAS